MTYVPEFGERLEINATGSAVDNGEAADVVGGSDSLLPLILIIAGVVLVLLIIIFLVVRSRRHKDGDAGTPTGFGEAGPAATPGRRAATRREHRPTRLHRRPRCRRPHHRRHRRPRGLTAASGVAGAARG